MTIGTRIALGFAAVLLLTVAVAFVGWNSLRTYAGRVDLAAHTAELDTRLKSVRIEEARFVTERDAKAAANVPGLLDSLRGEAQDTRAALTAGEGVALLDEVLAGIDGYRAAFGNFVTLDAEAHSRTASMETRARALKDIAEKIGKQQSDRYDQNMVSQKEADTAVHHSVETAERANRVIERVQEARRLQSEFLRTADPALPDDIAAAIAELVTTAEAVEKDLAGTNDETLAQQIVADVRAYETAFQAMRGVTGTVPETRAKALDSTAHEVQKHALELQENQTMVSSALREASAYAQSEVNEIGRAHV